MRIFLFSYLSIYGLMHLYLLMKARRCITFNPWAMASMGVFMLLMVLAPIIVRTTERAGLESFARTLAYLGFTWMGLLFLFVVTGLFLDLARYALALAAWLAPWNLPYTFPRQQFFSLQLVLVLLLYGYGLLEAGRIRVNHIEISSPRIAPQTKPIRIAQVSDVHLGLIVREKRLRKILDRVEAAKPDLLVSTGDFVDGQLNNLTAIVHMLAGFSPPLGKIAITGNHEFYAGINEALAFTREAGFRVLRNEVLTMGSVSFVGIDDHQGNSFNQGQTTTESKLLSTLPDGTFRIMLKHRPTIDARSLGHFDLQLSGHTHSGQIFPFGAVTRIVFPFATGQLNALESGLLYINSGSGTWGPPIRLLAPPEVTIFDLVHGPELRGRVLAPALGGE